MKLSVVLSCAVFTLAGFGTGQASEVLSFGDTSSVAVPAAAFIGAKPMKLPTVTGPKRKLNRQAAASAAVPKEGAKPSYRRGSEGGPLRDMIQIVPDRDVPTAPARTRKAAAAQSEIGTMAYGESDIPFSTSRVELSPARADVTRLYPFRAAGRLSFRTPDGIATCSAALIDRGLILTAAHCVTDYGGPKFSNFTFVPGYHKGKGAYGAFTSRRVYVSATYANGTDFCEAGASCDNDFAVIVLNPDSKSRYPGDLAGWFGLGFDGYGFTSAGEAQITQLGYPGSLDNGRQMIRNDSMGYANQGLANNTVIGSSMDAGSSGGPWVVNLGKPPVYAIDSGSAADPNIIVGVTSWGYEDGGVYLEQGSSALTSQNVGRLLASACRSYPSACSGPL